MGKRICCGVSSISFLIGAGLLIAGLVIVLNIYPNSLHNKYKDYKILGVNNDGTVNEFTDNWANRTYSNSAEFYVFNYTNIIAIMNRAVQPDVVECGPYVYDIVVKNDMVNFTSDGEKMTFHQTKTFVFNADKSCRGCDPKQNRILIPDIGFQKGVDQIENYLAILSKNPVAKQLCEKILNSEEKCKKVAVIIEEEIGTVMDVFGVSPFVNVTVDQLLFSGYTSPFMDKFIETVLKIIFSYFQANPPALPNPPIQLMKNGTNGYLYTVLTGKTDAYKTGYIQSFVNTTSDVSNSTGNILPASWWPSANESYCTKNPTYALRLDGTTADFFKVFVEKTATLPVFFDEYCRTLDLVYEKDVTVNDLNGYRFIVPASQFDYSLDNNCGFCVPLTHGLYEYPEKYKCLPSGLLDVSKCTGNPIVLSKPHFYQAADVVKNFVPRFKANYDKDETTFDIEPNTGILLAASKKTQTNMVVAQYTEIRSLSVMRPGAYPLMYKNEIITMDDKTKNHLNDKFFTPKKTIDIVCWIGVALGGVLLIFSAALLFTTIFCFDKQVKKNS